MSNAKATARRTRVERNIYRRADGKLEVGYRDSAGKQRWQTVPGGITAARAERDSILGAKGKGERVQPNPRLRFDEAADRWLAEQVVELRDATQASYRNSVETHLRPRWGRRRLDAITVDDAARLVRELRGEGKAEWTISTVLRAASRIFKFARRRMNWHGENPITGLEKGERPKTGQTARRRIFQGDELQHTLAAAYEPFRTLFGVAATTGARLSECLGLVWADLDLSDPDDATVSFVYQVDRQGRRQPLKSEESRRTVEIPRSLAAMLLAHKARSMHSQAGAFVFATRSGRALGQRNVLRELRRAMTAAIDERGRHTFPVLHAEDADGRQLPVKRGAVPNFHAFRHTAASEAIAAGDGAEEVSWQLGHKNSTVTRTVYVQEIKNAERRARRRAQMEARYGPVIVGAMQASSRGEERQPRSAPGGEIVDFAKIRPSSGSGGATGTDSKEAVE
jgi:integrase